MVNNKAGVETVVKKAGFGSRHRRQSRGCRLRLNCILYSLRYRPNPQESTMRAATLITALTIVTLVVALPAQAQRVTGRATDETARAPIPEVQVEALSQGRVV